MLQGVITYQSYHANSHHGVQGVCTNRASVELSIDRVIDSFGVLVWLLRHSHNGAPDISSPYSSGILRAKRLLCSNVYYAGQHSVASDQTIKSV